MTPQPKQPARPMRHIERVVELDHAGRRFTFSVNRQRPLGYWHVETETGTYLSPLPFTGNEDAAFFRALADTVIEAGL